MVPPNLSDDLHRIAYDLYSRGAITSDVHLELHHDIRTVIARNFPELRMYVPDARVSDDAPAINDQ